MQSSESKAPWADSLRALATVSVILLHASAPVLYLYGKVPGSVWWVGNVFDSAVRFCVPIFLMLTGALLLPKTYSLGEFIRKRVSRIVLPFIFWSLIYILYNLFYKVSSVSSMGVVELIKYAFDQFRVGASFHLWYVYMVVGIYLFIPIVSKWVVNSSKNEILYYIAIWLLAALINFPLLAGYKSKLDLYYFSGFLGYPIFGYWLAAKFTFKNIKLLSLFLILAGIAVTIAGAYWQTTSITHFVGDFYSYLSPNVIAVSVGVFLLFRHYAFKENRFSPLVRFISKYSFGVYLSHVLVMKGLQMAGICWSYGNPVVGILLTAFLTLVISLGVTYLLSRIPYGAYVSG